MPSGLTRGKELIGPYKNGGSDYRPEGCPDKVKVHDFVDKDLGKAVPYGVYDITANAGCVSVGIDNDTAQFSVNSIRRWLDIMGRERYPAMSQLTITAGGGGSNGSRVRLFMVELQNLADETGLTLQVCHYPPGTSKWNKACPCEGGDRTPAVLPHHSDMARQAIDQPRNRGRTDCLHHDHDWPDRPMRAGYTQLPEGHQGQQRGNGNPQYQGRRIPSGVELYHIAESAFLKRWFLRIA